MNNLRKDFLDDVCLYLSCRFLITTVSIEEIAKAQTTPITTVVNKTPLLIPLLGVPTFTTTIKTQREITKTRQTSCRYVINHPT